jgi:NAD(P)-dependent dehydrogenase (short-subunit alcohol dehydrogenase family)
MVENAKKTILITGANKGIGFEVVRQLMTRHSDWTIWLGARSRTKGLEAIKQLNANNVHLLELDVTSDDSIQAAANQFQENQIDYIIHNAGIAHMGKKHTGAIARDIFETNFFGIQKMDKLFLPLVKSRSIIVTARLGSNAVRGSSSGLQAFFASAVDTLTIEELNNKAEQYFKDLDNGQEKDWPGDSNDQLLRTLGAYGVSKAFVDAYGRILARIQSRVKIILVQPGHTQTELNGFTGRPLEDGAASVVWTVEAKDDEVQNGHMYLDGNEISFAA